MPAEIPDGAVIIARSILNSSLWTMRVEDRIVALTCIALCNRRRKKWFDGAKDVVIERGQFVRSREKFAEACNLPLQVVRTSLDHLESSDFLTRQSTRGWTIYTLPKYHHYQDLTKYSDIVGENLTRDLTRTQPAPNHKQQQQTPTPSKSKKTGKTTGTNGVVVVVGPDTWADPVLAKPSYRLSLSFLEEIKMMRSVANTLAIQKPVGLVLRVVQQARFQRSPAGWARTALENDWSLPEAEEAEIKRVVALLKEDVDSSKSPKKFGSDSIRDRFPRKPGESDDQWFKRASDELVASKKGARKA